MYFGPLGRGLVTLLSGSRKNRNMKSKQPTYRSGFLTGAAIVAVGLALQLAAGPLDWGLFRAPANYVALAALCLLVVVLHSLRSRSAAVRFLMSRQAAVPCLVMATLLTALMGLTRQVPAAQPPADALGITRMLSFWPFVLTYLWMTLIVGLVTFRGACALVGAARGDRRGSLLYSLAVFVCHLGLFTALTTATLGSPDIRRLKMICALGVPERRVVGEDGRVQMLSVSIELRRFIMETYDDASADVPAGMPRRFASEIEVRGDDGQTRQATVEVNRPATLMGWKIYQFGYDTAAGAQSRISILELVRDPWLPAVYAGIFMLLGGALLIFLTANRTQSLPPQETTP